MERFNLSGHSKVALAFRVKILLMGISLGCAFGNPSPLFAKSSLPPSMDKSQLQGSLRLYQQIQIQGGWPSLPDGKTLKPGSQGVRVDVLRRRLIVTGDLKQREQKENLSFDGQLSRAVQRFQARNGLVVDGIVGRSTMSVLNILVEQRIQQLKFNLSNWDISHQQMGSRYILVNIADYSLHVVENHKTLKRMRVVVGKEYRRTPLFSEKLESLVLNPYWYIPRKVAEEDILPIIKKDPSYLTRNNIELMLDWNGETSAIDPSAVEWSKVETYDFIYQLRQKPGPHNSLGRVKFILPNTDAIYLHDTPDKMVFRRQSRTFSSGCIRIEDPLWLARYLLKDMRGWSKNNIERIIARGTPTRVKILHPIRVHIKYWTAWVDVTGVVHFREDVYHKNR
ncbi:MAG: L,D-transpeptidase family protein [Proteobacteria bacterium]|nr:L,D-transpeptidase family protein [Pseudomonadota bacterium]